jgi:hypothetical protein
VNETKEQQEVNKRANREKREFDRSWSLKVRQEFCEGSSQMKPGWEAWSGSRDVLTEVIFLEVHQKVFSGQAGKTEVSRHIANVLAPVMQSWVAKSEASYGDLLIDKPHFKYDYHVSKRETASHFEERFGDLWTRAKAAVQARIDLRQGRRRVADEADREAQRLRQMSYMRKAHPPRLPRGGTGRIEGGQELPQEGSAES